MFQILFWTLGVCATVTWGGENNTSWTGKWFPGIPGISNASTTASPVTENPLKIWKGKWFPHEPKPPEEVTRGPHVPKYKRPDLITMGVLDKVCDDAKTNLSLDFDPYDVTFHDLMLCLNPYHHYKPDVKMKARHREYKIPAAMQFNHICMNTSIKYDYDIPTFGDHRRLWAEWGEYKYLPPQRWVHNLEHGGIVMLYHPCALKSEVDQLKKIVKNCIYRHIITPSQNLTPERPLALVAWGHSLEMSVISKELAIGFIKKRALNGRENLWDQGQYNHLLISNATIVSDIHDSRLCPYFFMYDKNIKTDLV